MVELLSSTAPSFTPLWEMAVRMGCAFVLGGALGIDRELSHKPAGLRTHMLVSIAAAAFALLTVELYHQALQRENSGNPDPLRVMDAVITGVAFLGAGTIIRGGRHIEGITTGASIWLAGAIGLSAGSGFYSIALLATVFGVMTLSLLGWITRRIGLGDRNGSHADAGRSEDGGPLDPR